MSSVNGKTFEYRAYIDGLRAIAVLAVLFYHADIGCRGGFIGVDVFFVLSGYLITGLILKEMDGGRFRIVEFWERRICRILPALFVVVLASLIAGWFLFLPIDFKKLGQSAIAQALLASNVYFWMYSGYFELAAEVKPLLHTWSLAVEEQFYLLFPLLLMGCKRFPRKVLIPVFLLIGGISFGLSVYYSYFRPSANFYLLPTRAWELLIGAFLAAVPVQRASSKWLTESLSWGGLLAILCAVFFYNSKTRFPGVAALLPCAGTALIIWANKRTLTSAGKLLAARPVVFIGLTSYSLYLWHWPVLVFYKYSALNPLSLSQRLLLLFASAVLAVLSWKFVETPFRKRRVLKSRAQIFSFAVTTTAILLLAGLSISQLQGLPSRIPEAALAYADGNADRAFLNDVSLKQALAGDFVELGAGDKHLPINLLVWGDSHAMATLPVFDILCKEHAVRGVAATHASTPPLVGYESQDEFSLKKESNAFNNEVVEFIHSNRVSDVVIVAMWGGYETDGGTTARFRRSLLDTISALKDTGARIWIMRQVPKHCRKVPNALASAIWHGGDTEGLGLSQADHYKACRLQDPIFEGISAPDVTILDPTDLFVNSNQLCRAAAGGKALYYDDHHLTTAGAMVLRPLFEPVFEGMGKNPKQD